MGDTLGDEARGMVVVGERVLRTVLLATLARYCCKMVNSSLGSRVEQNAYRFPDFDGHPQKYEDLKIMSDVVAKEVNILKVDVPRDNGRGWKRTAVEINAQDDRGLGDGWREGMAAGSKYVIQETWVKANDPHFDAKVLWTATPAGVGKQGGCPGVGVGWGARSGLPSILMALGASSVRRAPGV